MGEYLGDIEDQQISNNYYNCLNDIPLFSGTGGKCGFRQKLERHVYCHLSHTDGFRVYFSKCLVADTC